MDDWIEPLERGSSEHAWDLFITRYRPLVIGAIRHYTRQHDEIMDVFAHVCASLRDDNLRRLRAYVQHPPPRARCSTWLVVVVRNLAVDWFRARDGRARDPVLVRTLPPLQRAIFTCVFLDGRTHLECYETLRTRDWPELNFARFLAELRATYGAVDSARRGSMWREFVPPLPLAVDPVDGVDARLSYERVEMIMAQLEPRDRLAVELYVIEGLKAGAIARALQLPNAKAVYNRVYRALATVRSRLRESGVVREDL